MMQIYYVLSVLVTPHVGVWIETLRTFPVIRLSPVTPHVGVWIETCCFKFERKRFIGHTSCRCVD